MRKDRETYLKFKSMADDLRQAESWCESDGVLNRIKTMQNLYEMGYCKQIIGKWFKKGNEKKCSCCKFIYYSNNDEWNFCPNCGAKMKGGAE